MKKYILAILVFSLVVMSAEKACSLLTMKKMNTHERALLWVMGNSPQTTFRIELADFKIHLEKGFIYLSNLEESWSDIEEIDDVKQNQFYPIYEDDFCMTVKSIEYIMYSWVANFELYDEKDKRIIEESRETAALLFQQNWYEGLIEDEETLLRVDAAAKEYAKEFLEIRTFESEEEHTEFIRSLSKKQFANSYIIKPLCSEIPLVEQIMPDIVDLVFSDILNND